MVNAKDILLAIFVAYFVMDLACAVVLKRKRPLLFKHIMNTMKKEKRNICICIGLGLLAGGASYYFASTYL